MSEKKSDIVVKSCEFSELKKIGPKDLGLPFELGPEQLGDKPFDAVDVTLVVANESEGEREINLYTVSRPNVPTALQTSWAQNYAIGAQEEKLIKYTIPLLGMPAFDYKDYTGPMRYLIRIIGGVGTIPDENSERRFFEKAKYFDIPAEKTPEEVEFVDFQQCLSKIEKTSVLEDLHIEGEPRHGIKSLTAKISNFGENTQYLGVDVAAFIDGGCYQTQFFYEVRPGEERPADLSRIIRGHPVKHLRIRVVIIPEYIFKNPKARGWFLWRSYQEEERYNNLVAKLDYCFS
ncbi:MAG: hypothetical protein J7J76_03510 [Candidatus Latescibacteria bacterium]|nr:hypothetical protein [Candidatus Latescibacterota bacterium]